MTAEEKHTGKKAIQHGGLTLAEMNKFKGRLDALDTKMATIKGDVSDEWNKVEEAGGNKMAFKLAMKFMNMEETKAYDTIKSFLAYMTEMGFMQQMDLFDQKQNIEISVQGPAPQRTADAAISEVYKGGSKKNNGADVAGAMQAAVN